MHTYLLPFIVKCHLWLGIHRKRHITDNVRCTGRVTNEWQQAHRHVCGRRIFHNNCERLILRDSRQSSSPRASNLLVVHCSSDLWDKQFALQLKSIQLRVGRVQYLGTWAIIENNSRQKILG